MLPKKTTPTRRFCAQQSCNHCCSKEETKQLSNIQSLYRRESKKRIQKFCPPKYFVLWNLKHVKLIQISCFTLAYFSWMSTKGIPKDYRVVDPPITQLVTGMNRLNKIGKRLGMPSRMSVSVPVCIIIAPETSDYNIYWSNVGYLLLSTRWLSLKLISHIQLKCHLFSDFTLIKPIWPELDENVWMWYIYQNFKQTRKILNINWRNTAPPAFRPYVNLTKNIYCTFFECTTFCPSFLKVRFAKRIKIYISWLFE